MVAVVVTYNRRELLLEALTAVLAQTRAPDTVIVVDNASTDGTADVVRSRFPSVRLATAPRNTGGAGGFAYGMALALAGDADLIWLMDDDTVPEPGALRALLAARALPGPAARAGRQPGGVDRRARAPDEHPADQAVRQQGGTRSRRPRRGLPADPFGIVRVDPGGRRRMPPPGPARADYFLWNDDFEFTTRLLRGQAGLLCPASVVVHKTAAFGSTDTDPGERFFYEVRNKIWMLRDRVSAGPRRAGAVRRLDAAPLGPHVRQVLRPAHARILPGQGHRRRGADEAAADRRGAGVGRPGGASH